MLDLNNFSHSHDLVEIVHHGRFTCVRKTFQSDLLRATRNIEKQRLFQPIYTGDVRVCAAEVLEFSVSSDRAELLMPYVEGMTGHMFLVSATRNIASTLSSALSTLLYAELKECREEQVATTLFETKLAQVYADTPHEELKRKVESCLLKVKALPSELAFPIGPCHGDLTLGNIILNPVSGLTLIDFLDTYLETPLQDVAKLKQDFIYGWSFRKNSASLAVKAEIISRYHFPQAFVQIERIYPIQVQLLTLMALARISPYVKDAITKEWLINSLTVCLEDFPI